jgi:hypothetical protein
MDFFQAITNCFNGRPDEAGKDFQIDVKFIQARDERANAQAVATEILQTLYNSEKHGRDLERKIKDIVKTSGWTENVARYTLDKLVEALVQGAPMGQTLKDTFEKARDEALKFAKDHPLLVTVIALGICVILLPYVIEALGFGALGPSEGNPDSVYQVKYDAVLTV